MSKILHFYIFNDIHLKFCVYIGDTQLMLWSEFDVVSSSSYLVMA